MRWMWGQRFGPPNLFEESKCWLNNILGVQQRSSYSFSVNELNNDDKVVAMSGPYWSNSIFLGKHPARYEKLILVCWCNNADTLPSGFENCLYCENATGANASWDVATRYQRVEKVVLSDSILPHQADSWKFSTRKVCGTHLLMKPLQKKEVSFANEQIEENMPMLLTQNKTFMWFVYAYFEVGSYLERYNQAKWDMKLKKVSILLSIILL